MAAVDAFGFLCRLVAVASLLFATPNNVAVEFTTPHAVAPGAVGLCFESVAMDLARQAPSVTLVSGGNQFDVVSQTAVDLTSVDSPFRSPSGLDPLSVTAIDALLGSDPYFAASYMFARYDDFSLDGHGPPGQMRGYYLRVSAAQAAAASPLSRLLFAPNVSNCLLLAGQFEADRRYQLELTFVNPSADAAGATAPLQVWMAPFAVASDSTGAPLLATMGPKYGRLCSTKDGVPTTMHAPPAVPADTAPPFVAASCGPLGLLPSPRGECVACPAPATVDAGKCVCASTTPPSLIGPDPCPAALQWPLAATSLQTVAAAACEKYGAVPAALQAHTASDAVVGDALLYRFLADTAPLVDLRMVTLVNASLYAHHLRDQRQSDSPTRTGGLLPRCITCAPDGTFEDGPTGARIPLRDRRFKALATLRLMGMLLHVAGAGTTGVEAALGSASATACPALYDWQRDALGRVGVEAGTWASWPSSKIVDSRLQPGDIF